jgi:hypothetical protein
MVGIGESTLRAEFVDGVVKGFAEAQYKFKQAVTISPTSAWKNSFFRETKTALTGASAGNAIKGLSRGANFPQASVAWTRIESYLEKYGAEENIFWEDILTDDIPVQTRTLFRISEAVTKAVDDEIFVVLSDSKALTLTNGFTITATQQWNGTSAAIIDNLMQAKQLIAEDNYDVSNLMCFINPRDHRSIVAYLTGKGAQFPQIGNDMATNGRAGKLCGIDLVISNSVPASCALICVPKICATWREAVPLTTEVTTDPFKSVRIRAVEMGKTQLTDPEAVCVILGTQVGS